MYKNIETAKLTDFKNLLATSSNQEEVCERVRKYQNSLNEWVDYRRNVIERLRDNCVQLNVYKKNGSLSMAAGHAIGAVSGGLFFAGLAFCPPLAIGASIVCAVGNITGLVSKKITSDNREEKLKQFREYIEKDRRLLETLMGHDQELDDLITRMTKNERFKQNLQHKTDVAATPIMIVNAAFTASRITLFAAVLLAETLRDILKCVHQTIIGIGIAFDAAMVVKYIWDYRSESQLALDMEKACEVMEGGLAAIMEEKRVFINNEKSEAEGGPNSS